MMVMPKDIKELEKIFEQYLDGCHLSKNAPESAVVAYKKYCDWHREVDTDQ